MRARDIPTSEFPRSLGFAKRPKINTIVIVPDTPFLKRDVPPGYIEIDEALKAYHNHCLAYEANVNGKSVLLSMADLRAQLEYGKIRSYHVGAFNKVRELSPKDWVEEGPILKQIFRKEHPYIGFDEDLEKRRYNDKNVWLGYLSIVDENENIIGGDLVILADDLINFINSSSYDLNSADPASSDEVFVSRSGRPPQHDSETFLLEAFKIAYLDGAPTTQAELIERTAQAYQEARRTIPGSTRPPGETWMKERIRPIWKIIEQGRKGR